VPDIHDLQTQSDAELAARVTVEIRLRAVAAVGDGAPVVDVAEQFGVTRQTVTAWRRRYEANGLDELRDRSRRPHSSPHRIPPAVEALICELRREHRRWGARRIAFELRRVGQQNPPSRSTVHRALAQRTGQPAGAAAHAGCTSDRRGKCRCIFVKRPGSDGDSRYLMPTSSSRSVLDSIERVLELHGRDVAEVAVEPLRVVPVRPPKGRELEVLDRLPLARSGGPRTAL
jgi:transposase-like protein